MAKEAGWPGLAGNGHQHQASADPLKNWSDVRVFPLVILRAFGVEGEGYQVSLPERNDTEEITGRARRRTDGKPYDCDAKQLFEKGKKRGLIYSPERLEAGAAAGEVILLCEGHPDTLRLATAGHRDINTTYKVYSHWLAQEAPSGYDFCCNAATTSKNDTQLQQIQ